jgi:hypothetical protein
MVEKVLEIDLFDESAPENESLARLLDDGRWQELISKAERTSTPRALSPEGWKDFLKKQEGTRTLDESQWKEFVAEQEEGPVDPLAALVQELIEGP